MSSIMKHLVVDYFFDLCSEQDKQQAEKAIKGDCECSRLYNGLKFTVGQMDHLPQVKCPDVVVARMFEKINDKTNSQKYLESLLRSEFEPKKKYNFAVISRFSRIAAVVAIVVGVGATYMPVTKQMRVISLKNLCQQNLKNIGFGIANYSGDNAGMVPSVSFAGGNPWWKVGSQKEADHSNTRNQWLLVRNGYVDVNDFTCPSRPILSDGRLKMIDVCDYQKDFPSKDFVNYSFKLVNGHPVRLADMKRQVIAADSNPLFEESTMDKYTFFKSFKLDDQLRNARSINHYGNGQNVLFVDNSVDFNRDRMYAGDDIYTVKGTESYTGYESPSDEKDVFLAP